MKVTALVCRAGIQPVNMSSVRYGDWTTVVADLGNGPARITSVVKLHPDRWLLPGSPVTIDLDPDRIGQVHSYTVEWDSVPTIRDRIAAGDPVVTDPRTAMAAADAAMAGAGLIRPMPPGSNYLPLSYPTRNVSLWTAGCDEAIARIAATPAPPGMVRVVAILVGLRLLLRYQLHDLSGRPRSEGLKNWETIFRRPIGGTDVVFALTAPGRAPQAVFATRFKPPRSKDVCLQPAAYPYLPAVVPADGSGPMEILWQEVLDYPQQHQRIAAMAHQHTAAAFQAEMAEHARLLPPGIQLPTQAFVDASALGKLMRTYPPAQQQATLARMHGSLAAMPPDQRQAYLTLWRSYGLPI